MKKQLSQSACGQWGPIAVGLAFVVGGWRLFSFIHDHAVNLFYYDQWDAYTGLFTGASLKQLFLWQHGPHAMGWGLWFSKATLLLSHWNERIEQFSIGGVVVLGAWLAVRLKRKLLGGYDGWDGLLVLRFLSLAGWETLVGTAMPSIGAVPFLLILLAAHAACLSSPAVSAVLLVVLEAGAMFTGYAYVLVPLILFYFLAQTIYRKGAYRVFFLVCLALALLPIVAFFLTQSADQTGISYLNKPPSVFIYLGFLGAFTASFFGLYMYLPPLPYLGFLLFLGLLGLALATTRRLFQLPESRLAKALFFLLGATLVFSVLSCYGRANLGVRAAYTSRYYPYMLPGILALYLWLRTLAPRLRTPLLLLFFLGAGVLEAFLFFHQIPKVVQHLALRDQVRECLVEGGRLAECEHQVGYRIYPETTEIEEAKIRFLRQHQLGPFYRSN